MVALIVARSRNNVIGKAGRIPWRIRGEQRQFKELTTGNVVVMGRRSYEEIGHPLPNRYNIVVSQNVEYAGEGLETARSLEAALEAARGDAAGAYLRRIRTLDAEAAAGMDRGRDAEAAAGVERGMGVEAAAGVERGMDAADAGGDADLTSAGGAGAEPAPASDRRIYIAGGYRLFREAMPLVDRMYITEVDIEVADGDTFFPDFDEDDFTKEIGESGGEEIRYTRTVYVRKH